MFSPHCYNKALLHRIVLDLPGASLACQEPPEMGISILCGEKDRRGKKNCLYNAGKAYAGKDPSTEFCPNLVYCLWVRPGAYPKALEWRT